MPSSFREAGRKYLEIITIVPSPAVLPDLHHNGAKVRVGIVRNDVLVIHIDDLRFDKPVVVLKSREKIVVDTQFLEVNMPTSTRTLILVHQSKDVPPLVEYYRPVFLRRRV